MLFAFEKLIVYQKAVDFADHAAGLTEGFGRGYGYLADQLNRAALSISANIAEGNGRFTKPDRRNSSASPEDLSRNAYRCWNWLADENSSTPELTRPSRPISKPSPECSPA